MRPKGKPLTFNNRVLVLFSYHEGFTERLRTVDLRVFHDYTAEYFASEFQREDSAGFDALPNKLGDSLRAFLALDSENPPKPTLDFVFDGAGSAFLQCRMSDGAVLKFHIPEPIEQTKIATATEQQLILLACGLRDFGLQISGSASTGQNCV